MYHKEDLSLEFWAVWEPRNPHIWSWSGCWFRNKKFK